MPGPRIDPDLPEVVDLAGAATILGVSKVEAWRLQQSGKLPGRRLGKSRKWAFRVSVVEALKAKRAARRLREQSGDAEDDGAEQSRQDGDERDQ